MMTYLDLEADTVAEPTVRHEDNRAAMIADAARHGHYGELTSLSYEP